MIDEIIELLKEYTGKFVDEDYYTKLCQILMKYNNIDQNEFYGVNFITVEEAAKKFSTNTLAFTFTKAFYYEPEEMIYLIIENIKENTKEWKSFDLSDEEHYAFSNLVRSVYMFHEIEHVIQKRGKSGLEGMLITDIPSARSSQIYAISPREHFAKLYSYLIAFSVAQKMNMSKRILDYFKKQIFITLYDPYFYNNFDKQRNNLNENEPIMEYFHKINKPVIINTENVKNLDFLSRIIFELEISKDEFEHFKYLYSINGGTRNNN